VSQSSPAVLPPATVPSTQFAPATQTGAFTPAAQPGPTAQVSQTAPLAPATQAPEISLPASVSMPVPISVPVPAPAAQAPVLSEKQRQELFKDWKKIQDKAQKALDLCEYGKAERTLV